MKKLKNSLNLPMIILLIFLLTHITPNISFRTHVFIMGYFKEALNSEIEHYTSDLETKRTKFYVMNPAPQTIQNSLGAFKITRLGFIYITTYYGHG